MEFFLPGQDLNEQLDKNLAEGLRLMTLGLQIIALIIWAIQFGLLWPLKLRKLQGIVILMILSSICVCFATMFIYDMISNKIDTGTYPSDSKAIYTAYYTFQTIQVMCCELAFWIFSQSYWALSWKLQLIRRSGGDMEVLHEKSRNMDILQYIIGVLLIAFIGVEYGMRSQNMDGPGFIAVSTIYFLLIFFQFGLLVDGLLRMMKINQEISEMTGMPASRDTNIAFILAHIISEFILIVNEILMVALYSTHDDSRVTWYTVSYIISFSIFIADIGLVFVVNQLRLGFKTKMQKKQNTKNPIVKIETVEDSNSDFLDNLTPLSDKKARESFQSSESSQSNRQSQVDKAQKHRSHFSGSLAEKNLKENRELFKYTSNIDFVMKIEELEDELMNVRECANFETAVLSAIYQPDPMA